MSGFFRTTFFVLIAAGIVVLSGSALLHWIPGLDAPATDPLLSPGSQRITVDVRNAGGIDGMARAATVLLRRSGFDVVGMGNARRMDLDSSVVIDRAGNVQRAAAVAEVLGIRRLFSEPDSNLFVDVTVRLGSDWQGVESVGESTGEDPRSRLAAWLRGLGWSGVKGSGDRTGVGPGQMPRQRPGEGR